MSQSSNIQVRVFAPPAPLERCFNAIFLTEVSLPEGETISDFLMPSWGMVSLSDAGAREIHFRSGERMGSATAVLSGPYTHAARITMSRMRNWGFGLLPAGWLRFVNGPASDYANRSVDCRFEPGLSVFVSLREKVFAQAPDADREFQAIVDHLVDHAGPEKLTSLEMRASLIHQALQDAETSDVHSLADRARVSLRTLERDCKRVFGFPPKTLLRRKRFLRSMISRTWKPNGSWTGAMDDRYHDQAQFVREFREFMGMSPSDYAAIDKPLALPLAKATSRNAGR